MSAQPVRLAAPPSRPPEQTDLLVLLMGDDPEQRVRRAVAERDRSPERIYVLAPALVSPLDWLATADDEPLREAETRAFAAMNTLTGMSSIEAHTGDADPIQAVEDALSRFRADAILIAGNAADPDLEAALGRFELPVTRLEAAPEASHSRLFRALRSLASGRSSAAPFVLFHRSQRHIPLRGLTPLDDHPADSLGGRNDLSWGSRRCVMRRDPAMDRIDVRHPQRPCRGLIFSSHAEQGNPRMSEWCSYSGVKNSVICLAVRTTVGTPA